MPLLLGVVSCQVPAGPERNLSGAEIYQRHCARCHGVDGRGVASMPGARDLSNRVYMETRTDEQLRNVIMRGVAPNMPAFGGRFLEPSMKVLVAYVRGLSAKPAAPGGGEVADPSGAAP